MTVPRRARATSISVLCALLGAGGLLAGAQPASGAAPSGVAPAVGRPAALDPGLADRTGEVRLVVRARPGAQAEVESAVRGLGGQVTRELPLIGGFAATLPGGALPQLARVDGVEVVSEDRAVQVQASAGGGSGTSLAPRVVHAPAAWSAGTTGRGVTVALLDTGVADVPDLAGRIVPVHDDLTGATSSCYDLSGEGTCRDTYGHGTFMAGLIAGNGASGTATGTAPGARVLSVKIAGVSGAADVSTVLAAVQWVVSFRDTYDIKVMNLSVGTDSTQSWKDDPLNYAVERAWDAGVLVVVAAANTGPGPGTIAKPADDPWVVTVGAVDDRGTPGTGDDRSPDFSSRGPTRDGVAKPDVVAPGAHVLSLRSPGSLLDRVFPPADPTSPYRTGSGTSMAAAVASGTAALALQAQPGLSPDQLKQSLRATADPVASTDTAVVGAGLVDAYATATSAPRGSANAGLARSTGRGSIGSSRGSLAMKVDDPVGTLMTGRQTAQVLLWDPLGLTGLWRPNTWYTSANYVAGWNTATWASEAEWSGANWTGANWTGANWTGANWTGANWTGANWTGANWTGASWYGEHADTPSYGRAGKGSASYGAWD